MTQSPALRHSAPLPLLPASAHNLALCSMRDHFRLVSPAVVDARRGPTAYSHSRPPPRSAFTATGIDVSDEEFSFAGQGERPCCALWAGSRAPGSSRPASRQPRGALSSTKHMLRHPRCREESKRSSCATRTRTLALCRSRRTQATTRCNFKRNVHAQSSSLP